jgi:hypothetical protein
MTTMPRHQGKPIKRYVFKCENSVKMLYIWNDDHTQKQGVCSFFYPFSEIGFSFGYQ